MTGFMYRSTFCYFWKGVQARADIDRFYIRLALASLHLAWQISLFAESRDGWVNGLELLSSFAPASLHLYFMILCYAFFYFNLLYSILFFHSFVTMALVARFVCFYFTFLNCPSSSRRSSILWYCLWHSFWEWMFCFLLKPLSQIHFIAH